MGEWDHAGIQAAAIATDGTLVISGDIGFTVKPVPGEVTPEFAVAGDAVLELNPDGTLDTTLNGTGVLTTGGWSATPEGNPGDAFTGATELVAEPDNTILVLAGEVIYRANLDGSLDPTFANQGLQVPIPSGVTPQPGDIAMVLLPDGSIAVEASGSTQVLVSIYNADGSPGNAFSGAAESLPIALEGGNTEEFFNGGLAITPGGQILVAESRSADTLPYASDLTLAQLTDSGASAGSGVTPFPSSYQVPPGAALVTADLNGDGTLDGILVEGNTIQVINGKDLSTLVPAFTPFPGFDGSLSVAAADLNGDGKAELVVAAGTGGGPVIVVYDGAKLSSGVSPVSAEIVSFLGIDEPSFRGGTRIALGDLNGDGVPDLVVAAGDGGGPRVAIYDGKSITDGTPTKLVNDFFAYDPSLRSGAYVAVGDLASNGYDDLILGAGTGGGPRVIVLDGQKIVNGPIAAALAAPVADFFAGNTTSRSGAPVSVSQATGSNPPELVVTPPLGSTRTPEVFSWSDNNLVPIPTSGSPPATDTGISLS